MIHLTRGAGEVIAGDVREAVAAYDAAILTSARVCATVIEATKGSDVPVAHSQKVLRSLTSGLSSAVTGRGDIVSAIAQMTAIKAASNLAPVAYGCPVGEIAGDAPADGAAVEIA